MLDQNHLLKTFGMVIVEISSALSVLELVKERSGRDQIRQSRKPSDNAKIEVTACNFLNAEINKVSPNRVGSELTYLGYFES